MTKKSNKIDLFSLFYKNSLVVEAIIILAVFQILTKGMFLTVGNRMSKSKYGRTYQQNGKQKNRCFIKKCFHIFYYTTIILT